MNDDKKGMGKEHQEVEASIDALRMLRSKSPIYGNKNDENIVPQQPFCSFCGKGQNQVEHMLQGNNVCICDQCITLCYEIIHDMN